MSAELIPYASRTGTRRNLHALRRVGWRLLVSATGEHRTEGFERYAIDNGAWTAYRSGGPFDATAFVAVVNKLGRDADFVVVPDIVGGGLHSLDFSKPWLDWLRHRCGLKLLAVQDGMSPQHVRRYVGPSTGLFVGGTTEWKLRTLPVWGELARELRLWLHVGRVNTVRRIVLCQDAGARSFDGTSASRYSVTLPRLDNARRQLSLLEG